MDPLDAFMAELEASTNAAEVQAEKLAVLEEEGRKGDPTKAREEEKITKTPQAVQPARSQPIQLPPFKRSFLSSSSAIASWAELDGCLSPRLLVSLRAEGLGTPTAIQGQGIPPLLTGQSVLLQAPPASGKTIAFLLPMIVHVAGQNMRGRHGIVGCVVVPTRELALQVQQICQKLLSSSSSSLSVALLTPGMQRTPQEWASLKQRTDMVVATPGRLCEAVRKSQILLHSCSFMVLDEVDRLMELQFSKEIALIMQTVRADAQCCYVSATCPPKVRHIIQTYSIDVQSVCILSDQVNKNSQSSLAAVTATQRTPLAHFVYLPSAELKEDWILAHVDEYIVDGPTLIFTASRQRCEDLLRRLRQARLDAGILHGKMSGSERLAITRDLRKGALSCVVATDLVARGLDIGVLAHVLVMDVGSSQATHLHRAGRLRQGTGSIVTLLGPADRVMAQQFITVHKSRFPPTTPVPAALLQCLQPGVRGSREAMVGRIYG